jgi:WD40 repeat protein
VSSNLAFSPNGKLIAAGYGKTSVRLWTVKTREAWRTLYGHSCYVKTVAISKNGHILASGSDDQTIKLWRISSGGICGTLHVYHGFASCLSFSPDGSLLGSASDRGEAAIWNARTCQQIHVVDIMTEILWLKFSADSRIIVTNFGAHCLPLLPSSAATADVQTDSCYTLAVSDPWLTCDLENLLWIPPQYRTHVVATHDHAIALSLESGEAVILTFDFSHGRPWEDMTSSPAPNPTDEPLGERPESDVALARTSERRQTWHALKRHIKSSLIFGSPQKQLGRAEDATG